MSTTRISSRRGSALLLVLWLAAALGAIALAVASGVRSETERTTTAVESLKAYYLATGAIDRALLYIRWGSQYRNPDNTSRYYDGVPRLLLEFPGGQVMVDIIPEAAKLNVNLAPPEELYRLLLGLGAEPDRAQQIVAAIVDWRTPPPEGAPTAFDQLYLDRNPSFLARHASLEEIEELLVVQGMTPELFYGGFARDAQGGLRPRVGLRDCLSVYGATAQFDINTAPRPVLEAIGLPAATAAAVVERRRRAPFRVPDELAALGSGDPAFGRLRIGGNTMFTLRATARVRTAAGALSDTRRSVEALVKFMDQRKYGEPYHVLRWYDNVWVQ